MYCTHVDKTVKLKSQIFKTYCFPATWYTFYSVTTVSCTSLVYKLYCHVLYNVQCTCTLHTV